MNLPSQEARKEYRIEPLSLVHVPAIAEAHSACFPDFYLTSLGMPFVTFFYRSMVEFPGCFTTVAVDPTGRVVGFAAGAKSSDKFRHFLYRQHFLFVAWTIFKQVLISAQARRHIFGRLAQVKKAFRLIIRMAPPEPTPRANAFPDPEKRAWVMSQVASAASLMSMGLRPEYRGSGIAEELILSFEDMAREMGISCIELSTFRTNTRAIAFYEKSGYQVYNLREQGVDLFKVCRP